MKSLWTIALLISFFCLQASEIKIKGNGTPGPYSMGEYYPDLTSIEISLSDSSYGTIPYVYVTKTNSLLFSESIDSGVIVKVNFEEAYYGLKRNVKKYVPRWVGDSTTNLDTMELFTDNSYLNEENFSSDNKMMISGYKSVGVSVGSQGLINIDQGLSVNIFGNINEDTKLSANLSDEGTSLDGDTRELGEIDMLYINMDNPKYEVTIGDRFISTFRDATLYTRKKIKGLSGTYKSSPFSVTGFGAISGSRYAIQNVDGRLGFQGPYYLIGNGDADIINPVDGTVRVSVNGKTLVEGEEDDYTVDYDIGTITFTSRFPIVDNSKIKFEYEYKAFNYQRNFVGGNVNSALFDSTLLINGFLWYETDNKNSPLELNIDNVVKDSLVKSGNRVPIIPSGRLVNPNDVASKSSIYRLYKLYTDSLTNNNYYQYYEYNPNTPFDNVGYYQVWFRKKDGGNYNIDSSYSTIDIRGVVYKYVGDGKGNFSCNIEVPAPTSNLNGEIKIDYTPVKYFRFNGDLSGVAIDKNKFSNIGNGEYRSAATNENITIGGNDLPVAVEFFHRMSTIKFDKEIISDYELSNSWNIDHQLSNGLNIWESSLNLNPYRKIKLIFGGGQLIDEGDLLASRMEYGFKYIFNDFLESGFNGNSIFRQNKRSFRDSLFLVGKRNIFKSKIIVSDQWNVPYGGVNNGDLNLSVSTTIDKFISELLSYSQYRKDGDLSFDIFSPMSSDTGYSFIWRQTLGGFIKDNWNITAESFYNRTDNRGNKNSALLINFKNSVQSKNKEFSTWQKYLLNFEKASQIVKIPKFVGVGFGTHKYDSLTNDWVADINGDYIITTVEIFDSLSSALVRKSLLSGEWRFIPSRKRTGVLGDLDWKGSLNIEEYIDNRDNVSVKTWFPGYTTFSGKYNYLMSYNHLYYQQELVWHPVKLKFLRWENTVKPEMSLSRYSREKKLYFITSPQVTLGKLDLKFPLVRESLIRLYPSSFDSVYVKDLNVSPEFRLHITKEISPYIELTFGNTQRSSEIFKSNNKGAYYQFKPGISYFSNMGMAEFSYTWSKVNYDGVLEYPMAKGFSMGTSHTIDILANITPKKHFQINGSYRGEYVENRNEKWLHTISMELKTLF